MRLRALLDTDALGLRLLGGGEELDRTVRGVMTTDLKDPSRYLSGGELVLTGLAWRRGPDDSERFVRILTAAGVAGLAAGEAELGSVPDDLVLACARHRLPLFAVDEDVAFASITEHVVRQVSTERAGDLAAVVERHRRLMTSGPEGGGPDAVLDLLGSDLDLRAWVLSTTGRRIAGSDHPLPAGVPAELAAEHLAAARTGRPSPHRAYTAGRRYSLFPIRSGDPDDDIRGTLLSDWFLAVEADAGDWPAERLDLLDGVTQLIAVERDRRDAERTVRRRLAAEVMDLVQAGAPPGEIAARLRVAAPVLVPGLGTAPQWQVVVARVDWAGGGPAAGPVAQALLEEALVDPGAVGPDQADRIAVAHTGEEAMALVPLSSPGSEGADPELSAQGLLSFLRAPSPGVWTATDGSPSASAPPSTLPTACAAPWRRPVTPGASPPPARAGSASRATRNWPPTSCCCRSSPTTSAAPSPPGSSTRCGPTTGGTARSSSPPSRPSSSATAPGRAARTGCICTSTLCATASAGSSN